MQRLRRLWKPDPLKKWLRAALGQDLSGFRAYVKKLPQYRFIDVSAPARRALAPPASPRRWSRITVRSG